MSSKLLKFLFSALSCAKQLSLKLHRCILIFPFITYLLLLWWYVNKSGWWSLNWLRFVIFKDFYLIQIKCRNNSISYSIINTVVRVRILLTSRWLASFKLAFTRLTFFLFCCTTPRNTKLSSSQSGLSKHTLVLVLIKWGLCCTWVCPDCWKLSLEALTMRHIEEVVHDRSTGWLETRKHSRCILVLLDLVNHDWRHFQRISFSLKGSKVLSILNLLVFFNFFWYRQSLIYEVSRGFWVCARIYIEGTCLAHSCTFVIVGCLLGRYVRVSAWQTTSYAAFKTFKSITASLVSLIGISATVRLTVLLIDKAQVTHTDQMI